MINNNEIKKLLITELVLFVILVITILTISINSYNNYKKSIIESNSYVISSLIENHKELEEEIITLIQDDKKTDKKLLDKYGIDIDTLEYISSLKKEKRNLILTNTISVSLIFVILFIIYFVFTNKTYKEIRTINKYLNDALNNKTSINIKDYKEGDISNLKNDILKITTMLKEEKEHSEDSKKELSKSLQDISHQLKTPLTSMYVINDLLQSEETSNELKKELIKKNEKELKRIEWLVSSLLKISQLDSGTIELKQEKVNIKELINRALDTIKIQIEIKNQNLIIPNEDLYLICDFEWTKEALLNILKNAHEHTKDTININYSENNFYIEIIIGDNGNGIEKKDIKHIFERFYRGKTNKESIGIGLNMSKTIIEKQHGKIEVESTKGKTRFIIKFYKKII